MRESEFFVFAVTGKLTDDSKTSSIPIVLLSSISLGIETVVCEYILFCFKGRNRMHDV